MEIQYIPKEIGNQWISETKEISAMLVGLMRARRKMVQESVSRGQKK